jgi:hypothetical protein
MNDASPRFAEGQTGAASLLSSGEGNLRLAELAQHAVGLNAWVTDEGLRGATAGELFDGYCQRLSEMDVVIMRAYVSTQTLHPQWTGYGYTWRRELRSVREQQFARGPISQEWLSSPFNALIQRSLAGEKNPWLRRRLELGPQQRDFPALADFYAAGACAPIEPRRNILQRSSARERLRPARPRASCRRCGSREEPGCRPRSPFAWRRRSCRAPARRSLPARTGRRREEHSTALSE